ncbi:Dabb family protein [Marisediminicola sp. LYQ134]|uniref:Dabb family protein n=1 Tax=unclassified Marisediminicola TaxID=2618316 RepID=UPI003983C80D
MTAIDHIVLVQWAESATIAARDEVRAKVRDFVTTIAGVDSVTEGPSVSTEGLERAHDYGFIVRFTTVDARDAYLPDPVHLDVADLIGANAANVTVFDIAR